MNYQFKKYTRILTIFALLIILIISSSCSKSKNNKEQEKDYLGSACQTMYQKQSKDLNEATTYIINEIEKATDKAIGHIPKGTTALPFNYIESSDVPYKANNGEEFFILYPSVEEYMVNDPVDFLTMITASVDPNKDLSDTRKGLIGTLTNVVQYNSFSTKFDILMLDGSICSVMGNTSDYDRTTKYTKVFTTKNEIDQEFEKFKDYYINQSNGSPISNSASSVTIDLGQIESTMLGTKNLFVNIKNNTVKSYFILELTISLGNPPTPTSNTKSNSSTTNTQPNVEVQGNIIKSHIAANIDTFTFGDTSQIKLDFNNDGYEDTLKFYFEKFYLITTYIDGKSSLGYQYIGFIPDNMDNGNGDLINPDAEIELGVADLDGSGTLEFLIAVYDSSSVTAGLSIIEIRGGEMYEVGYIEGQSEFELASKGQIYAPVGTSGLGTLYQYSKGSIKELQ